MHPEDWKMVPMRSSCRTSRRACLCVNNLEAVAIKVCQLDAVLLNQYPHPAFHQCHVAQIRAHDPLLPWQDGFDASLRYIEVDEQERE